MSDEELAQQVRLGAKIAQDNIVFWIVQLQHRHDEAKAQIKHEDPYQMGYLHGLTSAIEFLNGRLDDIYKHDKEMIKFLKEMRDEDK